MKQIVWLKFGIHNFKFLQFYAKCLNRRIKFSHKIRHQQCMYIICIFFHIYMHVNITYTIKTKELTLYCKRVIFGEHDNCWKNSFSTCSHAYELAFSWCFCSWHLAMYLIYKLAEVAFCQICLIEYTAKYNALTVTIKSEHYR